MSPRRVLREGKAHCLEGAILAALALYLRGERPLLFDLKTATGDDHVVALYRRGGYWGAISKTNHATLRFRDPIYKNLRELALSYFHEYSDDHTGEKILRRYSTRPFDLRRFGYDWVTNESDLEWVAEKIDQAPHHLLVPAGNGRYLRRADQMERRAGNLREWRRNNPRT